MFCVSVQPLASVTVTTCGPAVSPVNTLEACNAPPSIEYCKAPVPPVAVTVAVPFASPKQSGSVLITALITGEASFNTVSILVTVQPY